MKNLILTSLIAAFALIGAAPSADARPPRGHHGTTIVVRGYTSGGHPIRAERYFIRYNRYGHPVWGYRPLPVRRYYNAPPRYRGHDRGYHHRDRRHYHGGGGHSRSGVRVSFNL